GFQSAETEILRVGHATGKIKARRIASARALFNLPTTRVAKPAHLGDFIERFACSIIHRTPDQLIIRQATNENRHRMATAHNQRNIRSNLLTAAFVTEER